MRTRARLARTGPFGRRRVFVVSTRSVAAEAGAAAPILRALGDRLVGRYVAVTQHTPATCIAEIAHQSANGLSHVLGKRIDAHHGIPHGVTSGLLLPHVMRFVGAERLYSQRRGAEALGIQAGSMRAEQVVSAAATAVADLINRLGLPMHLGAFGLKEADLVRAAEGVGHGGYRVQDLVEIYRPAWLRATRGEQSPQ